MAPSRAERQRRDVVDAVRDSLRPGEQVLAVLPFASTPKRPKGPDGKVRTGLYQSARRYRPLVVTDRRLLVVEAVRTPYPRGLLEEFPVAAVRVAPSGGRAGFALRSSSLSNSSGSKVILLMGRNL